MKPVRPNVRVHCPTCGDVLLFDVSDLTVRLCVDTGEGTYVFRCPECEKPVVRLVHPSVKEMLLTSGARVEPWFLPEEGYEEKHGAPITVDDVIDFSVALSRLPVAPR